MEIFVSTFEKYRVTVKRGAVYERFALYAFSDHYPDTILTFRKATYKTEKIWCSRWDIGGGAIWLSNNSIIVK